MSEALDGLCFLRAEQVPFGAQLKGGVCLSCRRREQGVFRDRRTHCWVLGPSCELAVSHSWEAAQLLQ